MPTTLTSPKVDLAELNSTFGGLDYRERFALIGEQFGGQLITSTSAGAQAAVMLHLVSKYAPQTPVIFVDTGYHFPETYQFLDQLKEQFELNLKVYNPAITAARQEALYGKLWESGDEGHEKYGLINKVEPMNRALREHGASSWLSGVRRAHSKDRQTLDFFMQQKETVKIYPILDWSDNDIANYITLNDLPRHPLVAKGYVSIGDWHSTKPLEEGMTAEQTRFNGERRECGLHQESSEGDYMI
jgi:phosphoadenosine phosphosulfate reductase